MKYIILSICLLMSLGACKTTNSTQADPVNLTQYLLKERGLAYDKSDYKKLEKGDVDISEYSEFDLNNHMFNDGIVYKVSLDNLFSNGYNIKFITDIGYKNPLSWSIKDSDIDIYLKDDEGLKINFDTLEEKKIDESLFNRVYRYKGDTLKDDTDYFKGANKIYDFDDYMLALFEDKLSILYSFDYLNLDEYRDMGKREYLAFDLEIEGYPIRIFNSNILMTNCAYYEIIYANEPNFPDTCNLVLKEIGILSTFYRDVRNIVGDYVICDDYSLLPLKRLLREMMVSFINMIPIAFTRIMGLDISNRRLYEKDFDVFDDVIFTCRMW